MIILSIIEMTSHIIFGSIIINDCWFGMILSIRFGNFIINSIGFVCKLFNIFMHRRVILRIFSQSPIILVTDISPSDFIVKRISFLFNLLKELLLSYLVIDLLYLLLILFIALLFLLIELISWIKIGSIWSFPELV